MVEKLGPNIPPVLKESTEPEDPKEVKEFTSFINKIYKKFRKSEKEFDVNYKIKTGNTQTGNITILLN